ncbi:SdpI family protein [Streptomyces sp. TM32]|uniref:SdpI family protein n=1 Tax=Streptomyces sp. TM32 TaxID=1652669 RepID=UPI0010113FAF|nr:SdpI family protein [Streptomyces sp. TM32]RXS86968.1 SdpI family protein [Streptomyces sp. TM32]
MTGQSMAGIFLSGIFAAAAVIVGVIAGKSRKGTLRKNSFAGMRSKETRSSDVAWRAGQYAAQRKYVRLIPVLGVAAVASLVNAFLGGPSWVYVVIVVTSGSADAVIALSSTAAARAAVREERRHLD